MDDQPSRGLIRRASVALLAIAALLALAATASARWSQYRGDAARTARALWTGATAPAGAVDWQVELGPDAMVDASPVVNPNTHVVYLGTTGETTLSPSTRLFAFYPNGNLQWAVPLDGYDVRAAPAVRRDGFPVVVGEQVRKVVDHRGGGEDSHWQLSERTFLVDQFTGAVRVVRSMPDGWFGMAPVFDESRAEAHVRTASGLWRLDSSLAVLDDLKAAVGAEGQGLWSVLGDYLCNEAPVTSFLCAGFDTSGIPVGQQTASPEPPRWPRLPSPAFSRTCDDVVWSLPQGVRAQAIARGARAVGHLVPPTPLATPALGKAGRLYAPTLHGSQVYLDAYDQGGKRAWTAGPLGDGLASPPALGRAPGERALTPASCYRVRVPKHPGTTVRDHRPDSVYLAVGPTLFALNDGGQLRWKDDPGGQQLGEPVVVRLRGDDELILVTESGPNANANSLVAYRSGGNVAWRLPLDGPSLGSPAVADGHVYLATTHSLYAIH